MYGVLNTERHTFLTTTKISVVPYKYSNTDIRSFEDYSVF